MAKVKVVTNSKIRLNQRLLARLYDRIYDRTMQQLGAVEREHLVDAGVDLDSLVDKHVKSVMKDYGFSVVES